MKKLVTALMCLFAITGKAQTYVPFDFEHSEWYSYQRMCQAPAPNDIVCTDTYYKLLYGGDTVSDGKTYKLIDHWRATCDNNCDSLIFVNSFRNRYAMLREDSGKIYVKYMYIYLTNFYWPVNIDNEVLLYDFTADIGDTIFFNDTLSEYSVVPYYLIVESKDSILTNLGYRKVITLQPSVIVELNGAGPADKIVWIEGVGSDKGLLYDLDIQTAGTCCLQWYQMYSLCYTQNQQYVYGNGTCDYPLGIEEKSNITISIFPNPTASILTINADFKDKTAIELYNTTGQLILSESYQALPQKQIDVSALPNGIYYLRLQNNGRYYSQKLVIAK